MQVGPTMTATIPDFTHDLRSYAVQPIGFIEQYFASHGAAVTHDLVSRVRIYPFISDLFGEWLSRRTTTSNSDIRQSLSTIVREVISNMTLTELAEMLRASLKLASDQTGIIATTDIASTLREFQLSKLADRVLKHGSSINLANIELALRSEPTQTPPLAEVSNNYSDFLSELKEAGVVIPQAPSTRTVEAPKAKLAKRRSSPATVDTFLSPDARNRILDDVFGNDSDDLSRSLDLINRAKDWKQASIYLEALFMRRKIDPQNPSAIRLADAVYARFNAAR